MRLQTIVIIFLLTMPIAYANVVINEVLFNAQGIEWGKEWIELYNPTKEDIDIGQWSLWKKGQTKIIKFPLGTKIKSQSYLLIGDDNTLPPNLYPDFIGNVSLLSNLEDGIVLKDALNQSIDAAGWGTISDPELYEGIRISSAPDGMSVERIALADCQVTDTDNNSNDFINQTPTPMNSSNICGPDDDNDVVGNHNDLCPDTKPEEEVDDDGCSNVQFCKKQNRCGRSCDQADWKANEPFKIWPGDCITVIVHRGGIPEPYCAGLTCAD